MATLQGAAAKEGGAGLNCPGAASLLWFTSQSRGDGGNPTGTSGQMSLPRRG